MKEMTKKRTFAYLGIIFVVLVWGIYPVLTADLLTYYSGGMFTLTSSLFSAVALLLICIPKLKELNRTYFIVAVPTGFFLGLANLLQKIGLQYTTPSLYAFLENLSCVVVPILLYILIRKKPGALTLSASLLCLAACYILSGMNFSGAATVFGKGELLCGLAGILYGVNIAATGVFAKKLNAFLYVMIQMWVNVIVSGIIAFALDRITLNGQAIESIVFTWDWKQLLFMAVLVLSISTLGWIIRTESMKYVNPSIVAVIMPFSSVVTGVVAVCTGKDELSARLLLGGFFIFVSSLLSSMDDIRESKNKNKAD